MRKIICFILCISLCLGLSLGCAINSDNSQSESIKESQTESLSESEQESITESETQSVEESLEESESEQESESVTEESPTPKGLLSLQEAFDLGILTHDDLLSIAYHSGNAEVNEEIDGDFEPSARPEMTEDVVLDITNSLSYAFNYLDLIPNETTADDFSVIGCYAFVNGYYVLNYDCSLFAVTMDEKAEIVDGVRFEYTYPIEVVQQKNEFIKAEAKKDYYESWLKVVYQNATLDQVAITVFGIFDDCLIGYFVNLNYYLADCHYEEEIPGYGFWVGNGDMFLVWKDGEFAGFTWALENGWLTMENIAQAHEVYSSGKGEYYE